MTLDEGYPLQRDVVLTMHGDSGDGRDGGHSRDDAADDWPTGAGLAAGPEVTVSVPHEAAGVRETRDAIVASLAGQISTDVLDDAVLLLSELVSNAVKHARPLLSGGHRVSWRLALTDLTVSVTDGGSPTRPRIRPTPVPTASTYADARQAQSGGRGLDIVDRLASAWGVTSESGEVTVWAMLPVAVPHPRAAQSAQLDHTDRDDVVDRVGPAGRETVLTLDRRVLAT